jgi:transposase
MEREKLERYLAAGLSLAGIAEAEAKHPSTVGYWLRRYGLVANGHGRYAPRGRLSRDELARLVERGATLREIATGLDRSVATVRHWLRRYGLRTSRRGRREAAIAAREAGHTRFVGDCARHGRTEFLAMRDGRSRCARCNAEAVAERRRRVKRILIEEAGNRCSLCGYDRFQGALQFHHLNPDVKRYALSDSGISRSLEKARAEARKCALLCANCHAEVEAGVRTIPVPGSGRRAA